MPRGLPRVLVLTGTSDHPFSRLLDALPALVENGVASEVRVQSRVAGRAAAGLVHLGMLSREAMQRELAEADVVITHGGSGSCFDAIRAGHRPIVVARRLSHGEHVDDHQEDMAAELERSGVAVRATDPLSQSLPRQVRAAADSLRPRPRQPSPVGERLRSLYGDLVAHSGVGATRGRPPGTSQAIQVTRVDAATYTAHYKSCPRPHPLQSLAWGEARRLDGWTPEWWVASQGSGKTLAGAQVLRRRNPLLPGYVPYGPPFDGTVAGRRAGRALLLRLSRCSLGGLLWAPYAIPQHAPLAREAGGFSLARPSQTGFVTLGTDEEMLARMRPKWRWALRKALRTPSLTVEREEPHSFVPTILIRVHALAAQKGFHAPIRPEVGSAFADRAADSGVRLLGVVVREADRVTNMYVTSIVGDWAHTLWSAHEPEADEGSGRLALWHLLRACRDLGCRYYDLSGIDDEGNPGVASFKRGVRPELLPVPGMRWLPPGWLPPACASAITGAVTRLRARRVAV